MKFIISCAVLLASTFAFAENLIPFNFTNEDITKVIETYSKAANQKFIIDPGVRGKITILMPEKISTEEAFNQLSSALAVNGYAISKQGDTMVVVSARNIERNYIETTTTVPSLKPERIVTWIYTPKNLSVDQLMRDLRIILSRDGEMTTLLQKNQLIITDWTSNLQRVNNLFAELDKPVDPAIAKVVEKATKDRVARKAAQQKEKEKKESKETPKDTQTE